MSSAQQTNALDLAARTPQTKPRNLRQRMAELHTWVGLLAGWLLYAMFLTGSVSYFRDEISLYLRPELPRPADAVDVAQIAYAGQAAQRVLETVRAQAPQATQIGITLPSLRFPAMTAYWSGGQSRRGSGLFDLQGQPLTLRETRGGDFFYSFHFNLHYVPVLWGRWIAGLCAMFMLVALISGIIVHKKIFIDFFTFRWGKGQRSWLDAHNALAVLGLPFHLMITYSGLITLMLMYMPWGNQAAYATRAEQAQVMSSLSAWRPPAPVNPPEQVIPMVDLAPLLAQAQQHWATSAAQTTSLPLVGRVLINNPGHPQARVIVSRSEAGRVSDSPRFIVFDTTNGQQLEVRDHAQPAAQTRGVLYALHMGRFADGTLRWLYFLVSLAGVGMVGTGLVLWTVKRRQRLSAPSHRGLHLVERLNVAAIAGLSVAMAAFFWLNRLLPLDLPARAQWEIHGFFLVWALCLLYACLRPALRAWTSLLALAALLLAFLPLLSALTTPHSLPRSFQQGDTLLAGFELTVLVFAALHAYLAWRIACHQRRPTRKIEVARPLSKPPCNTP